MTTRCVIGLDSSTQSTKAIAWDATGRPLAEGRADIPMLNPGRDRFEQHPVDWWDACTVALRDCIAQLPSDYTVDALAISNQRETVGFIGADGTAVTPAIVWLDERCRDEVAMFTQRFEDQHGANSIHAITGRPPDITPCLYTFAWMQKHAPQAYKKTASFVDVQSYLVKQLCGGEFKTGWISADPMGLFDMQRKCWSEPLLEALEITSSQLPTAVAPGELLGRVTTDAAIQSGLPAKLPVYAAGGDGQCAGLGTNCTVPDRAYVNLGTAVVSGIWSPQYKFNRSWRTEIAAQGDGYIFENCLRSGAFLLNWFVEQFGLDSNDKTVFNRLEDEATELPIGCDGLMVQPYWSGVMDPYWDTSARGVLLGLSGSHTRAHVYRAILEGITLDQVMGTLDMEVSADQHISHYVAIGGGAKSPMWRQMLADASGKPVLISPTIEASALGAGMIAAYGAGWYDTIELAAENMSQVAETIQPDPANAARYADLLAIYRDIYAASATLNQRLVAFAAATA